MFTRSWTFTHSHEVVNYPLILQRATLSCTVQVVRIAQSRRLTESPSSVAHPLGRTARAAWPPGGDSTMGKPCGSILCDPGLPQLSLVNDFKTLTVLIFRNNNFF